MDATHAVAAAEHTAREAEAAAAGRELVFAVQAELEAAKGAAAETSRLHAADMLQVRGRETPRFLALPLPLCQRRMLLFVVLQATTDRQREAERLHAEQGEAVAAAEAATAQAVRAATAEAERRGAAQTAEAVAAASRCVGMLFTVLPSTALPPPFTTLPPPFTAVRLARGPRGALVTSGGRRLSSSLSVWRDGCLWPRSRTQHETRTRMREMELAKQVSRPPPPPAAPAPALAVLLSATVLCSCSTC